MDAARAGGTRTTSRADAAWPPTAEEAWMSVRRACRCRFGDHRRRDRGGGRLVDEVNDHCRIDTRGFPTDDERANNNTEDITADDDATNETTYSRRVVVAVRFWHSEWPAVHGPER